MRNIANLTLLSIVSAVLSGKMSLSIVSPVLSGQTLSIISAVLSGQMSLHMFYSFVMYRRVLYKASKHFIFKVIKGIFLNERVQMFVLLFKRFQKFDKIYFLINVFEHSQKRYFVSC